MSAKLQLGTVPPLKHVKRRTTPTQQHPSTRLPHGSASWMCSCHSGGLCRLRCTLGTGPESRRCSMRHMRAGSAAGALPPGLVTQSFSEAEGRDFRSQTTNGSSNISGGGGVSSSGGATSGVTSASGASLPPARAAAADATAPVHGSGGSGAASASGAAGVGSSAPPPSATPPPATPVATNVFSIKPVYVLLFGVIMAGGLLFASMSLQLTSGIPFTDALTRVLRRILRSIAFRQLVVIAVAILLVRFSLNSVLRLLAAWSSSPVAWDKSRMYYVMKEVYSPLELLLFIAGCCTLADSFVPQLINVPKATVTHVVRVVLSTSFVVGAATVMYNLKSRFCKEQAWQYEMQGDVTSQRRWEAYDKLCTFAIYAVSVVVGIQALGLEVRSVLAIGGIGGLAIGLAGREICENILNGFLIMTTVPFEVGDEILFRPNGQVVEGIVVDVGWYRTTIRSFEREMYVIPNAVFSKNTVLNVSRKAKEWRFNETLAVRVQDVHKVNAIIQDIRRIVRNDGRIINKLHRRVFLDKITCEDVKVYVSFYVEGTNRDAFMAVKQDLLLAFVDCIERNGAKLATPRTVVEMEEATATMLSGLGFGVGMGGLPIVKVVEQVDVTPIAQIPAVTGQAPSASVPAPANGRDPSSNINGSSSGGGGGAKAANSAGKPASGDPVFQQPQQQGTGQQQQQQRQQQPASPSGGLQQQQPPQQPPQQPSQQQPQQQPPQQQQQPVPVGTLAFAAGAVSTAAASTSVPPRRGGDTAAPASRGGAAVAAAAGAAAAAGPEPSPPASASTRTPMASPLPGNPGGSYVVLSDYAAGWGVAGAAAVGASAAAAALTTDQAVIMASFEELY